MSKYVPEVIWSTRRDTKITDRTSGTSAVIRKWYL